MKDSMEKIKKHFDNEAEDYDELILTLIPHYHEMTDALVSSIPFEDEEPITVLDLGCGTGNITQKVKKRFPNSQIRCVDLAEKMILMARKKLGNHNDISFELSDFQDLDLDKEYHAIISSLALHHLENDDTKIKFYNFIYQSLKAGGVFYNADVVLGSSNYLQGIYLDKWKKFLAKNYSQKDIENKWIPTYRQEDRPVEMMTHIQWLKETGFKQIDIVWKYYNFGVYGGIK